MSNDTATAPTSETCAPVKMNIHRALNELKLADAKIEKLIKEIEPIGIYQKGKLVNARSTEEDFTKNAKAKFQAISDLIARKNKIKTAIVLSNGVVKVKVGANEMTVAEAINYKAIVLLKKQLIDRLKKDNNACTADLVKRNQTISDNAEKIVIAAAGKEVKDVSKDQYNLYTEKYFDTNTFLVCDPLEIVKTIETMESGIMEFESEVDAVLSESNALNEITIS